MKENNILQSIFEPVFYQFDGGYWINSITDNDRLENFLISNIRLDTRDLNQHTRRVLLNIQFNRKQQLVGALQDLFIATGAAAVPIKKNLLNRSKVLLNNEELTNFGLNIEHIGSFKGNKSQHSYLN